MRHDYTLFKRYSDPKNKRGIRWYFYYYDDLGNRKSKATGKAKKYEAEEYAKAYLESLDRGSYTLNDYTQTFFKWGECPWIKRQLAKGRGFSEGFASSRRRNLDLYILPKFGKRKLDSFNRVEIENWLIDLNNQKTKKPLANQTRNHILYTFRIVLREAEREGLIPFNCLQSVEPMSPESKKRDVFTKDELKKLFPDDLQEAERIWGRKEYVYLFYILATTGIRSGEVRALQWKHIIWGDPAGLKIERSVKNNETFGTTKTGTSRVVLLTT
jgi:integrase